MEKKRYKNLAVVLAAGKGSRMKSGQPKQYMEVDGKPMVCHSLDLFERCAFIDGIVLVVGSGEIRYAETEIRERYGYRKLAAILAGGGERCYSVCYALEKIAEELPGCEYVYIHDGARPFLDMDVLERVRLGVEKEGACIAAVPVKDTIKIVDEDGKAVETPERNRLWAAQTPQAFRFPLIYNAYQRMMAEERAEGITDDAQVLERMNGIASAIAEGGWRNIKITTPEDLFS